MSNRLWKYQPGANCAEPITARDARAIAWQGMDGIVVVSAENEIVAYRRANQWATLEARDDVGDLGLDWEILGGSAAVLIEY